MKVTVTVQYEEHYEVEIPDDLYNRYQLTREGDTSEPLTDADMVTIEAVDELVCRKAYALSTSQPINRRIRVSKVEWAPTDAPA